MDSNTLTIGGIVFLVACPIVAIGFVIWARMFFRSTGSSGAEAVAREYLDAMQAQNFKHASEVISVTVLRDDQQRQAWMNKMEANRERKRLVRYTLSQPRVQGSHDSNPGQVEITVEATELIGGKEYPAHLALRMAIDKASGKHRIVYSPDIYEETYRYKV